MKHEIPLPCSQDPATDPWYEPNESNPHILILFIKSHLYDCFHLLLSLPRDLFLHVFLRNSVCIYLPHMRASCPAYFVLVDLFALMNLAKSINYEASCYTVSYTLLLYPFPYVQIPPPHLQHPVLHHPVSVCVLSLMRKTNFHSTACSRQNYSLVYFDLSSYR
jgi:hypothetical protein